MVEAFLHHDAAVRGACRHTGAHNLALTPREFFGCLFSWCSLNLASELVHRNVCRQTLHLKDIAAALVFSWLPGKRQHGGVTGGTSQANHSACGTLILGFEVLGLFSCSGSGRFLAVATTHGARLSYDFLLLHPRQRLNSKQVHVTCLQAEGLSVRARGSGLPQRW
jgi:hypothetical protein